MICDLKKLELVDDRKTKLMAISISEFICKKKDKIFYVCEFSKLTSSYDDLIVILTGTKLPTSLKKLDRFTAGTANV
jgi:hypothetical protein